MADDWRQRLIDAMERAKLNPTELARHSGLGQTMIRDILKHRIGLTTLSTVWEISHFTIDDWEISQYVCLHHRGAENSSKRSPKTLEASR